jgi:hypothetical protein
MTSRWLVLISTNFQLTSLTSIYSISSYQHTNKQAPVAEGTPLQTGFSFFYMRRGKAAQSEKQQQQQEGNVNVNEGEEEKSKPSYFDAVKIIGEHLLSCSTSELAKHLLLSFVYN